MRKGLRTDADADADPSPDERTAMLSGACYQTRRLVWRRRWLCVLITAACDNLCVWVRCRTVFMFICRLFRHGYRIQFAVCFLEHCCKNH